MKNHTKNFTKNKIAWFYLGKKSLQCILIWMVAFFFNSAAFADLLSIDHRYEQSVFLIKNSTPYPLLITVYEADGTWGIPIATKEPLILEPSQSYKNRLISISKHDEFENFASIEVAQLGNERENYLIFSEIASSKKHYLMSHIPDGLGSIFVNSDTNHCDHDTPEGYAYCELIVKLKH